MHEIIHRPTTCTACRSALTTTHAIEQHNVAAASTQERSYQAAVNVPARTVEARRMPQGSGAKARVGMQ